MILAILQARVSSLRLPGKVLRPIFGQPMLTRQIERVRRARLLDELVVATSQDASDDPIAELCGALGVHCFRGSLDDVLDRFHSAARLYSPKHIVRLTGDCPLADPELIGRIVEFYLAGAYDYASNTITPSFPDGLDVEVFRMACLVQAWEEAKLPSHREHVTPFLYENPRRFRLGSFRCATDLSSLRWTVDEPADFDLVTRIYEALYPERPEFSTADILAYLDAHPEMKSLNKHIARNEGLEKSQQDDLALFQKSQA